MVVREFLISRVQDLRSDLDGRLWLRYIVSRRDLRLQCYKDVNVDINVHHICATIAWSRILRMWDSFVRSSCILRCNYDSLSCHIISYRFVIIQSGTTTHQYALRSPYKFLFQGGEMLMRTTAPVRCAMLTNRKSQRLIILEFDIWCSLIPKKSRTKSSSKRTKPLNFESSSLS